MDLDVETYTADKIARIIAEYKCVNREYTSSCKLKEDIIEEHNSLFFDKEFRTAIKKFLEEN